MTLLRTGIDLVEINRLEALNPVIRRRFLERVYTAQELEASGTEETAARWAFLAGRFAAKEAVSKTLGCGIGAVAWKDIEIGRGAQGEPVLKLHSKARQIAAEMGLETWSVSISHSSTHAVAVAVAIGQPSHT